MNQQCNQGTKVKIEQLLNSLASQTTNITLPEKCMYCPYMFEYKCRADKCINNKD